MDDRWQWAEDIWLTCFEPMRSAGYDLERVNVESYWKKHESELQQHFPPEAFINTKGLRSPAAKAGQERLADLRQDHPLTDFCIVRRDGKLAASFCGIQKSDDTYRMWHTNVHPDFRRRGLYQHILRCTIDYSAKLGFDYIASEHAPCNNAVIIAKLKSGFRIHGIDVHPFVGMSVNLLYFHNADHLAAYKFRCGLATLNPRILEQGSGAMGLLVEQMRKADD